MRARLSLLSLALVVLAGCSHRDHANPFDPLNPETGGRPAGFAALADDGLVRLTWQPSSAAGLTGFQLARRVRGDAAYVAFPGLLSPSSSGLLDFGLANGTTYEYQLNYVFDRGLGRLPAEDHATPGPARAWAVDDLGGAARRLTADGHHVLRSVTGFTGPTDLTTDPGSGAVLVSDPGAGTLEAFYESSSLTLRIGGLDSPGDLAVNPSNGDVWVCDVGGSQVRHFHSTLDDATPSALGPLDVPDGVAIDPIDRSVWVCERDADQVRRCDVNGVQLGIAAVARPSRIAIDSLTRQVWVTSLDRGRVVRLTSSMVPIDTLRGFAGPVGLAIDARRGRTWIADPVAGAVIAVGRDGIEQFRVGALPGARAVAVDLATGEAWAAAATLARVVRISPAGAVLETADGFVRPWNIAFLPAR